MFAREKRSSAQAAPAQRRAREAAPATDARAAHTPRPSACPCGGGCPRCAARGGEQNPASPERKDQPNADVQPFQLEDARVPSFVRDGLRSGGEPLAPGLREHFEPQFGSGLHNVRVHKGRAVRAASMALRAQAFAVGNDIGWPDTAPEVSSLAGKRLMAHELAHVMQQRASTHATSDAGNLNSEREARAAAAATAFRVPVQLTPTRPGLALSVEEFMGLLPDLTGRSYSQLVDDVDQITEWLSRQTTSTEESVQLESALVRLRAEVARRNQRVTAKTIRPPRRGKDSASEFKAVPGQLVSTDDRPRVLIERASPVYNDADDRKEQLDKVVAWLQRSDVSKTDRALLRFELTRLAPGFEKDRAASAGERRGQLIQKAIGIPADGDKNKLIEAMGRIESIRPLAGSPGLQYLMKGHEMIVMTDATVAELLAKTVSKLDEAASKARSMNEGTFYRANDFVKVNDEHQIVGFIVSKWSGTDPYEMWKQVVPLIQSSNILLSTFKSQRKAPNSSLSTETAEILEALEKAQTARQIFNTTFDGAMDAADQIVNGLEIVRDVSFTIVLALGAAIAAPVVAAGVAGLGATGLVGGGLTIAGTSGVVGLGGAALGGGSTLLAGGSTDQAEANAWKWGKRGIATGAAGGTTQVLGTALRVGGTGLSTASNLARNTVAQAGGNFVGNATGTALENGSAKDVLVSGLTGAGTAILSAPVGAAANSFSNPLLRAGTNIAGGGAVAYGSTYALTGNSDEALKAAGTAIATASVLSLATPPKGPTEGQKRAFELGRSAKNTGRAYLAAATLGLSNPDLPFRGTGATVGSILEQPAISSYSAGGSSTQTTAPSQTQAVTQPSAVANQGATATTQATSIVTPSTPQIPAAVPNVTSPVGVATQAAGVATASSHASQNPPPGGAAIDPALSADADRAFAEDAAFQVSEKKGFQLRQRVTKSGKQYTSLETIALTPAQRQAAARVNGQRLNGGHLAAWNAATNADEIRDMAEVNRLWALGTPAEQQQARNLARDVFDKHVGRYWAAERRDPTLTADFTDAGMRFDLTKTGAPRYRLPSGEQTGMTLDHNTRLSDDPTRALTGTNLSWVLGDENSVTLEDIRNNDPHQR